MAENVSIIVYIYIYIHMNTHATLEITSESNSFFWYITWEVWVKLHKSNVRLTFRKSSSLLSNYIDLKFDIWLDYCIFVAQMFTCFLVNSHIYRKFIPTRFHILSLHIRNSCAHVKVRSLWPTILLKADLSEPKTANRSVRLCLGIQWDSRVVQWV